MRRSLKLVDARQPPARTKYTLESLTGDDLQMCTWYEQKRPRRHDTAVSSSARTTFVAGLAVVCCFSE